MYSRVSVFKLLLSHLMQEVAKMRYCAAAASLCMLCQLYLLVFGMVFLILTTWILFQCFFSPSFMILVLSPVLYSVLLLLHYSPNIYFLVHALVKNLNCLFPLSSNKEDAWKDKCCPLTIQVFIKCLPVT